jgi:hypothetical protein
MRGSAPAPVSNAETDEASRWLATEFDARHARVARVRNGSAADVAVPLVLRTFDPAAVVRGAVTFAATLDPRHADSWYGCYTRAYLLFGNPRNLATRQPVVVSGGDDAVGWLGVWDSGQLHRLRRLLRPVSGELPALPPTVAVRTGPRVAGAAGSEWDLWLATAGLGVVEYLVHLHHTVAEATLTGALRPGDIVRLRHAGELDPARTRREPYTYVRVHLSHDDPRRLRLYTVLRRHAPAATPVPAAASRPR